jgi:tetratricopeptide (TPR) repeat protein
MRRRLLIVLCSVLLLAPVIASADSGSNSSDNPWDKEADPKQIKADYDDGYRQLKAGEYKAAIKAFKRVVRADPKHAMAYTNMAYSYRKLGKYDTAITLYTRALEIDPKLAEAHEYMGEAQLALGNLEEAKKHLAILERLDPKLAGDLRASIARQGRS